MQSSRFLQACTKQSVDRVPVWYMRQAGRYDPEYRKIKESYSLLEICRQPDLAAKVTLMPVNKMAVDAAILYSDIMNPVASIGIDFDIVANVGPVIANPIRVLNDVKNLRPIDVQGDLSHILETIKILRKELHVPLITFAGAPFTIASYLIEGRPSKNYRLTKQMMFSEPETWFLLMDKLADMCIDYLKAQIDAGAQAVQLFDSWVGSLAPHVFKRYVYPSVAKIFSSLETYDQPKIYFPGVSSGELLCGLQDLNCNVIGLDWRVSISEGRKRTGNKFAIQGNLDPYLLTAPKEIIAAEVRRIIDEGIQEAGYIFNLGHGLFPEASLETLIWMTEYIHEYSAGKIKTTVKG
jgi:uroporphyrinogen decarboxylase